MHMKNEVEYTDWKAKNDDPYGAGIVRYAERWADLMEQRMEQGESLEAIAKTTSHEADTEGVTG